MPKNKPYRSKSPFRIEFEPASLPAPFPFHCGVTWMNDIPIERLHTHECLELGLCMRGSGVFVMGSDVFPFDNNTLSVVPPGVPHLACSAPGVSSQWRWYFLEPFQLMAPWAAMEALKMPDIIYGKTHGIVLPLPPNVQLRSLLEILAEEYDSRRPDRVQFVQAVVLSTWLYMCRLIAETLSPETVDTQLERKPADIQRIGPALNLLAVNIQKSLSMKELADACHVSVATLRRLFMRSVGTSPQLYRRNMRLRMAWGLIRSTDRKIIDIALDCGFETLSNFNRAFQSFYGTTPKNVRRCDC